MHFNIFLNLHFIHLLNNFSQKINCPPLTKLNIKLLKFEFKGTFKLLFYEHVVIYITCQYECNAK